MERGARHAMTSRTIESQAVRLVRERGYDQVTVDMICEASGVSQRTFFNHFPTKLDAVVGLHRPRVDEGEVRRFLASTSDDLLGDLLGLAERMAPGGADDPELMAARWAIITTTPALLQSEMERLLSVQRELAEVIELRMTRHAEPGESPDDIRAQAVLLAHIVAAFLRFSIEGVEPGGPPARPDLESSRRTLEQLLPKLARPRG
ncbi:TetR/AcrR family transcriptional regulator [Schumannella luteola]